MSAITSIYHRILIRALKHRRQVILSACGLVVGSVLLATRLGSEFIPSLDEGDIALHALRIPGTSLSQAIEMQHVLEKRIQEFPEVKNVFAKIGTAEIATDPMPPNVADGFVILKPRSEWPEPTLPKSVLVERLEAAVRQIPGNNYEFTQPIQMRFNELIAGVRADIAVKVFGDDMSVLAQQASSIEAILKMVPGAADTKVEQTTGLPLLTVLFDREKLSRFGISLREAQQVLAVALGGESAGLVFEGDRRFEILVRLTDNLRSDLSVIERLPIPIKAITPTTDQSGTSLGRSKTTFNLPPPFVILADVAQLQYIQGPNQVSRENGKRRVVVTTNVRGRDLGSFVHEAQQRIEASVPAAPGTWISWGGQFEQLISAEKRLAIVVPASLLLIVLLLYLTFRSIGEVLLVCTGIPLALSGGIVALWLRDIPLSISAAVGFIALSGVAVLNSLVMISFIKTLRNQGHGVFDAIVSGSLTRLRPVLMTALVASLGFIPMALSHGTGAEVQRPLATVVIGGIISSTILTLVALPALYASFIQFFPLAVQDGVDHDLPDAKADLA